MIKRIIKKTYELFPFKKEIFSAVKFFFPSLPENVYQHLHFKGIIDITVNKTDGRKFKLYHDGESIENQIFWKGINSWYEGVSMQYWIKLCNFSEVVMDIGAYHGIYALVAASIHPDKKVFAFEPVKGSYNILLKNIRINHFSIKAFNCAVSDEDGMAEFYNIDSSANLIGSLNKKSFIHPEKLVVQTIPVRSAGSILREFNLPKIDLVKIDVEGHEINVLQGMYDYLRRDKPSLILEVLNEESARKLNELFKELDYLYFDIDEINPPRQIHEIKKSAYFNLLICTNDVAKKINLL
jgi:FkbM family methyltransferase